MDNTDDFDENGDEDDMTQVIIGRLTSLWTAEQPFWDASDVSHGEMFDQCCSSISNSKRSSIPEPTQLQSQESPESIFCRVSGSH